MTIQTPLHSTQWASRAAAKDCSRCLGYQAGSPAPCHAHSRWPDPGVVKLQGASTERAGLCPLTNLDLHAGSVTLCHSGHHCPFLNLSFIDDRMRILLLTPKDIRIKWNYKNKWAKSSGTQQALDTCYFPCLPSPLHRGNVALGARAGPTSIGSGAMLWMTAGE